MSMNHVGRPRPVRVDRGPMFLGVAGFYLTTAFLVVALTCVSVLFNADTPPSPKEIASAMRMLYFWSTAAIIVGAMSVAFLVHGLYVYLGQPRADRS